MTRLRTGRDVPQHVYEQRGPRPSKRDRPLFTVPTARLAQEIVAAVNERRDREAER